jgi:hypothetical protein
MALKLLYGILMQCIILNYINHNRIE